MSFSSDMHSELIRRAVPDILMRILSETPALKQSYLVGGCVRDALLGILHKDFDIEVFGVTYEELVAALNRWGKTDLVGRSFGVVKLNVGDFIFDFTIPRRDSKVGPGHKGFEIGFDSDITPRDAAGRRDFTINALMFNPRTGEVLDHFGGLSDLQGRVLRHTSSAFTEDPLRALRGMQFAARFKLQPAPETIELCRRMKATFPELAVERIREEWFKWAEKSVVPSLGLHFLKVTEWIEHFPELQAMIGTPQDPEWHPEGDVFIHTCHCCDALAGLPEWHAADAESRIVYMLAILLHDCGKPSTTRREMKRGEERVVSPGHEHDGGPIAETFLNRIGAPNAIRERIIPLIQNHMAHLRDASDRSVRRLSKRLQPENIPGLCVILTADSMGRPPLPAVRPKIVEDLLRKAEELNVRERPPSAILMGRHLMDLGLEPSPLFGKILHEAYDAQLEGAFFDLTGACRWLDAQAQFPLAPEIKTKLKIRGGGS